MLMEFAQIEFFDQDDEISVYGTVHSAQPYLRFILKGDALFRVESSDISFSCGPVISAVVIMRFVLRIVRVGIMLQVLEKIAVN